MPTSGHKFPYMEIYGDVYFTLNGNNKWEVIVIPVELINLINLAMVGLGTVIGYFLKDYLDRRKEAEIKRIADRRDHYRTLILALKSLSKGQRDNEEALRYEYSFLWLYAPDAVIRSFNHLLHRLNSESDTPQVASEVGELVLAMRRDLGFKDTRLSASEFVPHAK